MTAPDLKTAIDGLDADSGSALGKRRASQQLIDQLEKLKASMQMSALAAAGLMQTIPMRGND